MAGGWLVEVTRTVRLEIAAEHDVAAMVAALDVAWEWLPKQAAGGDQGDAQARVIRAGDLPSPPEDKPGEGRT